MTTKTAAVLVLVGLVAGCGKKITTADDDQPAATPTRATGAAFTAPAAKTQPDVDLDSPDFRLVDFGDFVKGFSRDPGFAAEKYGGRVVELVGVWFLDAAPSKAGGQSFQVGAGAGYPGTMTVTLKPGDPDPGFGQPGKVVGVVRGRVVMKNNQPTLDPARFAHVGNFDTVAAWCKTQPQQ